MVWRRLSRWFRGTGSKPDRSGSTSRREKRRSGGRRLAATDLDAVERFWAVIERTTPAEGAGSDEHVDAIGIALREQQAGDIVSFQACLKLQQRRLNRWDLWGVAYVALGGCGDDSFDYFRNWLIAQGREYVERALADPERAVDALSPGDEADCESLDYVADDAHQAKTGDSLPRDQLPEITYGDPVGEPWSEDDVYDLFPAVTRRFE